MGEIQQGQIDPAIYANPKKSKKTKPAKKTPEELIQEVSDLENDFFLKYTFIVIAFILKTFSDSEHKMSTTEIASLMLERFCDYHKDNAPEDRMESMEKTVRNNLAKYYFKNAEKRDALIKNIEEVFPDHPEYDYEEYTESLRFSENILKMMLGGSIRRKKVGASFKYWFEPMISRADVQLIESSVISNRYFSKEEKDYYRNVVDLTMSPVTGALRNSGKTELPYPRRRNKDEIEKKKDKETEKKLRPDKPDDIHYESDLDTEAQYSHTLSMDDVGGYVGRLDDIEGAKESASYHRTSSCLKPGDMDWNDPNRNRDYLNTLNKIYDYVQSGHQIRVTTGRFDLWNLNWQKKYQKPKFISTDHFKIINPYALVCDRGFMYLIATNEEDDENKVYHFRVDRISDVEIQRDKEGNAIDRAPVPSVLAGYFKKYKNGTSYFDEMAYTSVHPMMVVGNEEGDGEIGDYTLVVDEKSLNVLYDYVGTERIDNKDLHKVDISKDNKNGDFHLATLDRLSKELIAETTVRVRNVKAVNMRKLCEQYHELFILNDPPEMRDKIRDNLLDSVARYLMDSGMGKTKIEFWGQSKGNGKLGIPNLIPWRFV